MTEILFCRTINAAGRCLAPTTNFGTDLQRIEVNWRFQNLPRNTRIHHRWYRNGQLMHERNNVIWDENANNSNGFHDTYYEPGGTFGAGTWQLRFYRADDGLLLGMGTFVIGNPEPGPSTGNFSGTWQTNFATMTLRQTGSQVTGSYTRYSRTVPITLTGTVSNGILRGTNERGTAFTFRLNADGTSFSGTWNTNHRTGGWVELTQIGDTVNGRYYNGSTYGTLSGSFELFGTTQLYSMAGSYQANNNANDRGFFRFNLPDLDSSQFQGCWRNTVTGNDGNWCGWPGAVGSCPQVSSCQ